MMIIIEYFHKIKKKIQLTFLSFVRILVDHGIVKIKQTTSTIRVPFNMHRRSVGGGQSVTSFLFDAILKLN